jgi:hypothetical protein
MFATVRRALQMDALGCCPAGLQILAFNGLVQSAKLLGGAHGDSLVQCHVALPKPILLPLLDELFCSYDSYRQALWPVNDPVLAYLSRQKGQWWNSSAENPARRAEDSRIALPGFLYAIQHVMASTLLRQLRPSTLHKWTLRLTEADVRFL